MPNNLQVEMVTTCGQTQRDYVLNLYTLLLLQLRSWEVCRSRTLSFAASPRCQCPQPTFEIFGAYRQAAAYLCLGSADDVDIHFLIALIVELQLVLLKLQRHVQLISSARDPQRLSRSNSMSITQKPRWFSRLTQQTTQRSKP